MKDGLLVKLEVHKNENGELDTSLRWHEDLSFANALDILTASLTSLIENLKQKLATQEEIKDGDA